MSVWRYEMTGLRLGIAPSGPYRHGVNENHRRLCPSEEWASYLQSEVLPALHAIAALSGDMLEVGPGPGAATEWLRHHVTRLVAVEVDPDAASSLRERYLGTNVEVLEANATALDFADAVFDVVGSFTMLHHVPTLALQRAILAEAWRVLRPGGVLVGSDSVASVGLHEFHAGDAYNPIDPAILLVMLRALGFVDLTLKVDDAVQFVAHKPTIHDTERAA